MRARESGEMVRLRLGRSVLPAPFDRRPVCRIDEVARMGAHESWVAEVRALVVGAEPRLGLV
jgi:hypothetical protein